MQGDDSSYTASISAGGRTIAFESYASTLIPGDANGARDVFCKDLVTGTLSRVSVNSAGAEANSGSSNPSISADGLFVAFVSYASNLVPGDSNADYDVFRKDLRTGEVLRVSATAGGGQGNGLSESPSICANGRYVAFVSSASNLIAGDTNEYDDVFCKDLHTGALWRVSVGSEGGQGNGGSFWPSISADGRYIAFVSYASSLVSGDTNGEWDVFRKDLQSGALVRVSVDAVGGQANDWSNGPSISADGRFVAFQSLASNLVLSDTNATWDVFRKDLMTGAISRVSLDAEGAQGNGDSLYPSISAGGRSVAFQSDSSNLVPDDTNGEDDVFRKDIQTGTIVRVSAGGAGGQANDASHDPLISADGRYVAFDSNASNLVPGDTNGWMDVFCKDLGRQDGSPSVRSMTVSSALGARPKGVWVTVHLDRTPTGRLTMTVDTPNSWLVPPGPVGVSGRTTSVRFFVGMTRSPQHGEKIQIRTWLLGIPFSVGYRFP